MKRTKISDTKLREMSDSDFLTHCRKFPYWFQWYDAKAYAAAETRLARIQGARYVATGKTSSFKATKLR